VQTELWRAPYVDLDLYMGRWYEICRKPQSADDKGLRDVLVDHSRGADGSIDLLSSFDHPVLGNRAYHGVATPQDSSGFGHFLFGDTALVAFSLRQGVRGQG